jgi:hypothetical protein
MKTSKLKSPSARLPVTRNLTPLYASSLVVTLTMAIASAAGLLAPARIYPTDELRQLFMSNDVVNLIIGVPILLGSMWCARRGTLVGLLFWPGALMYVLYNYIAYVFGAPVSWVWLLYMALVALSTYTLIGLVATIDGAAVQQRLAGAVPERLAGGISVGFGVLFFLRVVVVVASALVSRTAIPAAELPVLIPDFLLSPAWAIGGVLLWQRKALGYVSGAGLLFQASMLFIGLIIFLLLQPLLTDAPFAPLDVLVVSIMGLICFVPFGLFVRGALRAEKPL